MQTIELEAKQDDAADVPNAAQCEVQWDQLPVPGLGTRQLQHCDCRAELTSVSVWVLLRCVSTAPINPSIHLLTCCIKGVIFNSASAIR